MNDAAFTTANIIREAGRQGLPWRYLPIATRAPEWSGPLGHVRRAARGLRWEALLARHALGSDLLHVHVASVVRHTGWIPRPYVLHLHGTDIRSHQYQTEYAALVRRAVTKAVAVLYSTPDLAEHVTWRPDASLFPVPIETATLPGWRPSEKPTVLFVSRWEEVKGLDVQLKVADLIVRRRPGVGLIGVDWGSGADRARQRGVRLVPKLGHREFLRLVASAHVVVGQPTGMLAASELEALGIGVPVVAALNPRWYEPIGPAVPPVLGGLDLGAAHPLPPQDPRHSGARALSQEEIGALAAALTERLVTVLDDPFAASAAIDGSRWLTHVHDVAPAVDRLKDLYARVV